jgi:glycerophosphoryl diester phosphodiesterase
MMPPVVIAHRGFNHAEHVENSAAAFSAAIAAGVTWLETDLRATKDGVLVLSHDATLARFTGMETAIGDSSWHVLSKIKLNGKSTLMAFEDFALNFAGANWTLDIKPETGPTVIAGLKDWATSDSRYKQLQTRTKFLFWDWKQEKEWRDFMPDAQFYARRSQCYLAGISVLAGLSSRWTIDSAKTYAILPHFFGRVLFEKNYVGAYQAKGAKVLAFLPESAAEFSAAIDAGVDEILVDSKLWPD